MSEAVVDTGRLEAITLEELVARASLQRRVDRKYVVCADDALRLGEALPPDARVLEIGGRRTFRYVSTYFDTPARDAYLRTAYRRRHRFKVRTRTYAHSSLAYLEVKTRQGRFTVKERTPAGETGRLDAGGVAYVHDRLASARVEGIDASTLAPCLETRYERATVLLPDERVRVTFDTGLGFATWVGGRTATGCTLPGLAIVETKSAGPPSTVDHALWRLGIRPVAVSKFGTGLAALEPQLPHARWARLLRTSFRPGPETGASPDHDGRTP